MEAIKFIAPELFRVIFFNLTFFMCLFTVIKHINSNAKSILYSEASIPLYPIIFTLFIAFFMGLRPVDAVFGDTGYYVYSYENIFTEYSQINWKEEWLWASMAFFLKNLGFSSNTYIFIIAFFYTSFTLFCCWKLFSNNVWISLLFFFCSLSFYAYGVNGIRNGMACSMTLFGISLCLSSKRECYLGGILLLLALGIHRSTYLPIGSFILAHILWKKPKFVIVLWGISIIISLISNDFFTELFSDFDFDSRMNNYIQSHQNNESIDLKAGTFRWDFIIYSSIPLLMFWYVNVKRNFKDKNYNIIASTYVLSNIFWIMVIRASFSNRFAYLSWFIYPLVIAYPLLHFNLWDDQDKKTAIILFLYASFTFFMFIIDK